MAADAAWAWLGDMELDDALLGIGAAGVFQAGPPLAIGFLVNAVHCADKGSPMRASEMYKEKRAFLDALFCGSFYPVLDAYPSAGKARGWVGDLPASELTEPLGAACGLKDGLADFLKSVVSAKPKQLHLLVSGPFLGRGEEVFDGLSKGLLAGGEDSCGAPRVVLWMYAGSFNLAHSSEQDRQALRRFAQENAAQVAVVETTLKSGAWLCDPPAPFWGSSCPTAWTVQAANANRVGFDVSTDIQSVNMFLEGYSSQQRGDSAPSSGRGLRWLFERLAQDAAGEGAAAESLGRLLRELEARSLVTNLMKMVNPDSSSMQKVREAMSASQTQLEEAFESAKQLSAGLSEGEAHAEALAQLTEAAKAYAELYRGAHGDFVEAGCVEYFPAEKPYSGPRLDKRCILRCMAGGQLQGGPTADVLILLALILHLEVVADGVAGSTAKGSGGTGGAQRASSPGCLDVVLGMCSSRSGQRSRALPSATVDLFALQPGDAVIPAFTAVLRPGATMDEALKRALAPLVDEAIEAMASGASRLRAARSTGSGGSAAWGVQHGAA